MGLQRTLKSGLLAAVVSAGMVFATAEAATLTTLYSLRGSGDVSLPTSALIAFAGTLYGVGQYGGAHGYGAVYALDPKTGAEAILYSFTGGSDGSGGSSLVALNGRLYGTTQTGGTAGYGTIYAIDPTNGNKSILYSFAGGNDGSGGVGLISENGLLYGVTSDGGASGAGTIFSVNPTTGAKTTLYEFKGGVHDGSHPLAALVAAHNILYGTAANGGKSNLGSVFSFDLETGVDKLLYSFRGGADGANPSTSLLAIKGLLYGVTQYGGSQGWGSLYAINVTTHAKAILYSFDYSTVGAWPRSPLIEFHGNLLGTTNLGAGSDYGSVFSVDISTGAANVLYDFGDGRQHQSAPTALYGHVYCIAPEGGSYGKGAVIEIDKGLTIHSFTGSGAGSPASLDDLASGGLTGMGSSLFVAAPNTGAYGEGETFALSLPGGSVSSHYSFSGGLIGGGPSALTPLNGMLYGVTVRGGDFGGGTIFSIYPASGRVKTLSSFASGTRSAAPMIALDGVLYGPTDVNLFIFSPGYGETNLSPSYYQYLFSGSLTNIGGLLYGTLLGTFPNEGGVYSFNLLTGQITDLYTFIGATDGGLPYAGLTALNGLLYGVTSGVGIAGNGTIFVLDPGTGAVTTLHDFAGGNDGATPYGGLVALNGLLYGATVSGGTSNQGVIFSYNPATTAETVIYSFTGGADGGAPYATMIAQNGVLYGMTSTGGAANVGTIFSFSP